MKSLLKTLLATLAVLVLTALPSRAADLDNILLMDLKDGQVAIMLLPEVAPKHVARIKELVRTGFYDGLYFHRVIPGFMAQGGDPEGTGRGGSGKNIPAEFSNVPFKRGTCGMARAQDPDSADSQFFICFDAAPFLDGKYTVWGRVVSGMQFVDKIKKGAGQSGQVPYPPDKILRMRIAADVKK
ncbi:peptidylprolyl isomerase [Pseudodesulfovibrio sp.]|uniref:peptidylprolyl isomerase n=1 Tax=Pseudodesulfovibrio sp. TaxID=2035812 RepID=UPI00261982A1|nr:peptidylprolyl isomerase [Pseudodesulfovibrio sp.]MDD3311893.1 peptidylprolyl isomerase [Pseudodesulfovibrio sp.]